MQNNIVSLANRELLELGQSASAGAQAIGKDAGLVINKATLVNDDFVAADAARRACQVEVAGRVPKAAALEKVLSEARTWCFRAKDTLKPFLGESHNSLCRPTGFVTSLRVPQDYGGLLPLVGTLAKYLVEHPEQTDNSEKVNVTAALALELVESLRSAKRARDAQDALIGAKHDKQEQALEALRNRLRGLVGELKQLLGPADRLWRRFGFNIPAEPETPAQPADMQVNNTTPGQLLVSCAAVAFAERYRWFVQKALSTDEPVAVGSSIEPLFVVENLEPAARFNVFGSAVNLAGNEGPRSEVVVADVLARAAA
jgi:hypothetical protein